jgi:SAM-dependent methyltransferase
MKVEQDRSEVDRIRRVYSGYRADIARRWSGENAGNVEMKRERDELLHKFLSVTGQRPLAGKRILEIGCGSGGVIQVLKELGARERDLFGIDLMPDRIELARARMPEATFSVGNAERLSFDAEWFDIVLLFTVFGSILDAGMQRHLASETLRVLKPVGVAVIYDFRVPNPINRDTRRITRRHVRALFPYCDVRAQSLTVVPPLVRKMGRATRPMYRWLGAMPWLRTHNMYAVRKLPQRDVEHLR